MYRSRKSPSGVGVRRWQVFAVSGFALATVGAGLGIASADAAVPTINCPQLTGLPAVPDSAQAEVKANLDLLNTQINEANNRLATSVGQGGPNFIQNAILGPLQDKRNATIHRIETAIGRQSTKPNLSADSISTCGLNTNGAPSVTQSTVVPSATAAADGTPAAAVPTINCPQLTGLPAVPDSAQAEVKANLDLLNTQINEANNRLATSVGQGGPNFIQNAILGPLQDKRNATIHRIETAIGRQSTKPNLSADSISTCGLNTNGAPSVTQSTVVPAAAAPAANGGTGGVQAAAAVRSIDCPQVTGLPAVPQQAQAEVQSNLQLLNTQISEANNRLATSVGQGGPNFVQNAILGPLRDKRIATIHRIETAIGRNAPKPNLNAEGLSTCTLRG